MDLAKVLRVLIITEVVLLVAGIAADFLTQDMLGPQLRALRAEEDEAMPFIFVPAFLVLMVAYIIAWIGLWRFWRHARSIYSATWVLLIVLNVLAGPYISTGITNAFDNLGLAASGAILALVYFSGLSTRFSSSGSAV
jgi:hypothetical protein